MSAIEFGFAVGANNEDPLFAQLSQQMSQEPECASVSPMQIICVEEEALFTCEICKYLCDGVEEKQSLLVRL